MIADLWYENAVVYSLDVETFLATSHEHRWWQEARSDPESRFRDWYVWSKKRPKLWNRGTATDAGVYRRGRTDPRRFSIS
jgi:glycosidase